MSRRDGVLPVRRGALAGLLLLAVLGPFVASALGLCAQLEVWVLGHVARSVRLVSLLPPLGSVGGLAFLSANHLLSLAYSFVVSSIWLLTELVALEEGGGALGWGPALGVASGLLRAACGKGEEVVVLGWSCPPPSPPSGGLSGGLCGPLRMGLTVSCDTLSLWWSSAAI